MIISKALIEVCFGSKDIDRLSKTHVASWYDKYLNNGGPIQLQEAMEILLYTVMDYDAVIFLFCMFATEIELYKMIRFITQEYEKGKHRVSFKNEIMYLNSLIEGNRPSWRKPPHVGVDSSKFSNFTHLITSMIYNSTLDERCCIYEDVYYVALGVKGYFDNSMCRCTQQVALFCMLIISRRDQTKYTPENISIPSVDMDCRFKLTWED